MNLVASGCGSCLPPVCGVGNVSEYKSMCVAAPIQLLRRALAEWEGPRSCPSSVGTLPRGSRGRAAPPDVPPVVKVCEKIDRQKLLLEYTATQGDGRWVTHEQPSAGFASGERKIASLRDSCP